jgi:hypothetical protein
MKCEEEMLKLFANPAVIFTFVDAAMQKTYFPTS